MSNISLCLAYCENTRGCIVVWCSDSCVYRAAWPQHHRLAESSPVPAATPATSTLHTLLLARYKHFVVNQVHCPGGYDGYDSPFNSEFWLTSKQISTPKHTKVQWKAGEWIVTWSCVTKSVGGEWQSWCFVRFLHMSKLIRHSSSTCTVLQPAAASSLVFNWAITFYSNV